MKTVRILLLITLPALIAAAASTIGMLMMPDLPDVLAVHWGVDGAVDRLDGLGSYVSIVAITAPSFALGAAGLSISPLRHGTSTLFARSVVAISTWFGVFIALSMFLGVQAQRGVADASSLPVSTMLVPLLAGFAVAAAVAALAVLATPRLPQVVGLRSAPEGVTLGEGERVYWSQMARSPRAVFALPLAIAIGIGVLFTVVGIPLWVSLFVVLVLALLTTTLSWRVVVDQRGITATGLFGFPRFQIPLQSIAAAAAIDVRALGDFGGWGVRFGRSGGWGIVTRSGAAIEVQRHSGANFVVTVDGAETAAGLLTSLARRV
jgi:hypothetical protein